MVRLRKNMYSVVVMCSDLNRQVFMQIMFMVIYIYQQVMWWCVCYYWLIRFSVVSIVFSYGSVVLVKLCMLVFSVMLLYRLMVRLCKSLFCVSGMMWMLFLLVVCWCQLSQLQIRKLLKVICSRVFEYSLVLVNIRLYSMIDSRFIGYVDSWWWVISQMLRMLYSVVVYLSMMLFIV